MNDNDKTSENSNEEQPKKSRMSHVAIAAHIGLSAIVARESDKKPKCFIVDIDNEASKSLELIAQIERLKETNNVIIISSHQELERETGLGIDEFNKLKESSKPLIPSLPFQEPLKFTRMEELPYQKPFIDGWDKPYPKPKGRNGKRKW